MQCRISDAAHSAAKVAVSDFYVAIGAASDTLGTVPLAALHAASESDTATFAAPRAASEIRHCNFSLIQMGMAVAREMFLDLPCPS